MAHEIVWTKTAQRQYDSIVDYIKKTWSETVSIRFVIKTNQIIDLLLLYPDLGWAWSASYRGFVI